MRHSVALTPNPRRTQRRLRMYIPTPTGQMPEQVYTLAHAAALATAFGHLTRHGHGWLPNPKPMGTRKKTKRCLLKRTSAPSRPQSRIERSSAILAARSHLPMEQSLAKGRARTSALPRTPNAPLAPLQRWECSFVMLPGEPPAHIRPEFLQDIRRHVDANLHAELCRRIGGVPVVRIVGV
jgi:hypothetical protein